LGGVIDKERENKVLGGVIDKEREEEINSFKNKNKTSRKALPHIL